MIVEFRVSMGNLPVMVSGRISLFSADLVIEPFEEVSAHDGLEFLFVHEPGGHLLILFNLVDEDVFQNRGELIPDVLHGVCHRRLPENVVCEFT